MKKSKLFLLSALSLFMVTSCGNNENTDTAQQEQDYQTKLEEAIDYVKSQYQGNSTAFTGEFERMTEFSLLGDDGVSKDNYTVTWDLKLASDALANVVTKGEVADKVQKFNVTFNEDFNTKESKFDLTATVTDANGHTISFTFKYTVPKYEFCTLARFMEIATGNLNETVTVKGKVVAYYKDGPYLVNEAGEGFYAYGLTGGLDSMKTDGTLWPIGTEITVSGKPTKYNGQYEFSKGCTVSKKNDASTGFEVTFKDLTTEFTNAASNSDASLAKYINSPVEFKGVTVGDAPASDAAATNLYYYFNLGENKYYFRPYASWYNNDTLAQFTEDQAKGLVTAADWTKGYTATVRGILGVYSNAYYISPIDNSSYTITSREVPDSFKVQAALEDVASSFEDLYDGTKLTLPAKADNDATYSYELTTTPEGWSITGNELIYSVPTTDESVGKVKVTATLNDATASKEYTVKAFIPEPISVKDFLGKTDGRTYFVKGYVTAVNGVGKKDSFVLTDAEGYSVFSYNKFDVKLGDEIVVKANVASNNGLSQLGTTAIFETLTTGNDITKLTYKDSITKTSAELKAMIQELGSDAKVIEALSGKLITVDAYAFLSGSYCNLAAASGETTALINTYANSGLQLPLYAGKHVLVKGFLRGTKFENTNITLQIQSVDFADEADRNARYSVTLPNVEHCTVAPKDAGQASTDLVFGTELSYTISVDEGYEVKSLKVNDNEITAKDGEFTVTVTSNTAITVEVGSLFNGAILKNSALQILDNSQSSTYNKYKGDQVIGGTTFTVVDVMPNKYGGSLEAIQVKASSGKIEFNAKATKIEIELFSANDYDSAYSWINVLVDGVALELDKTAIQATKTETEGVVQVSKVDTAVNKYTITINCDGTTSHKYTIANNVSGASGARYLGNVTVTYATDAE